METKPCLICKGNKTIFHAGFTYNGNTYPDRNDACSSCKGTGEFPQINEPELMTRIVASRGRNKGQLKASMASNFNDLKEARAYYVWRLARFHGGKDVCLPMMADLGVRGDPFKAELDRLADTVAQRFFGTHMAAARAWSNALGR